MSLRMKLTLGLGFLFLIIFALAIYSSYEIQALSKDADRILKDNYDSLVYCKNMLLALDDMRSTISSKVFGPKQNKVASYYSHLFESSKSTMENNLNLEKNNITEVHEGDYVAELDRDYTLLLNLGLQINERGGDASQYFNDFLSTYANTRDAIVKINDVNMQAVERKNQKTKHDAGNMIIYMGIVGTICILLAFFYFWYFPFYVSNSISYLEARMAELLKTVGIKIDAKSKDEAFMLLHSIDLLENRFGISNKTAPRRKR